MVTKKQIETILSNIINNITVKCGPTIAEIHSALTGMSYDDQLQELYNQNLFYNDFEKEDYENLKNEHELYSNFLTVMTEDDDEYEEYTNRVSELEDELFSYGRRLVEGIKPPNPVPEIDTDQYEVDNQYINRDYPTVYDTMGDLEIGQIKAQSKIFKKDTDERLESPLDEGEYYTSFSDDNDERYSMNNYLAGDVSEINKSIYHDGYLNRLSNEQRKEVKDIDNLMNKSPGLQQDTILYRSGDFNIHLREGDHSKFKGYTSTTFQQYTANEYRYNGSMTYIIHAPKGTKGICGNDDWNFKNDFMEHEYTLPRNIGYTVMNIDWENMTCEIVLDEP